MADNGIIAAKTKSFALKTIKLAKYLNNEKKDTYMSQQFLANGTAIGANVREALITPGSNDYYGKMKSALSHANTAAYWLELLYESDYIDQKIFDGIFADCQEIIKTLIGLCIGRENVVSH